MGKVNADKFGSAAPKLTPDDIEEGAILTITAFEEADIDDEEKEDGTRHSAHLQFTETGDKVLWLNKSMIEALIEQLGDETDDWMGQKIPVESYTAKFRGRDFKKVGVMPADKWDAAFKAAGQKRTPRKATASGKKK